MAGMIADSRQLPGRPDRQHGWTLALHVNGERPGQGFPGHTQLHQHPAGDNGNEKTMKMTMNMTKVQAILFCIFIFKFIFIYIYCL
jgi:hypothetical protein